MKKSEIALLINIACLCGVLSVDEIATKILLFMFQLTALWLQTHYVKKGE